MTVRLVLILVALLLPAFAYAEESKAVDCRGSGTLWQEGMELRVKSPGEKIAVYLQGQLRVYESLGRRTHVFPIEAVTGPLRIDVLVGDSMRVPPLQLPAHATPYSAKDSDGRGSRAALSATSSGRPTVQLTETRKDFGLTRFWILPRECGR